MASINDYKLKHSDKLIRENASPLEATRIQQLLHRKIDNALDQITNVDIPGIADGTVDLTAYFKLAGRFNEQAARGGTTSTGLLRLFDNAESYAGNSSTGRIDLIGGTVRIRQPTTGLTSNIFEVTNSNLTGTWFRVDDDGQSYFAVSTTAGVVNIAAVAGGTSLSVGSSGTTTVINHVLGASDYNHRVIGTGDVTWRHNTAGNALAGTWDGNFLFQPPTGTTTTVPVTIKGRVSQTGDLTKWQDSTGTDVLTVTSAGKFWDSLFGIVDNADATKTLKFELGSSTANADITLDYRSVTDRSLIFNMSGASGTASGTLVFPQTTVARTWTYPNATVTLAGLQLAQTFTRAQAITPTTGTECLALNYDQGVGTTDALVATDTATGEFARLGATYNGMAIAGNYSFYPFGGALGSGFAGTIAAATLSAARIWTFPNFAGNVLVGGPTTQGTGQTASVPTSNLVTAASNPSASTWLINCYLAVTTADAGGGPTNNVSVTIGWTDVGAARTNVIASRTLTATGATQGTVMIQAAASTAITFFTTYSAFAGGATEAYAYYIQATKLG